MEKEVKIFLMYKELLEYQFKNKIVKGYQDILNLNQ